MDVEESYAACRRITRDSGSNFAVAFRFLPREKRRAMEVFYAWMRRTDDMADGETGGVAMEDANERQTVLERWREELNRPSETTSEILPAFFDVMDRYQIDRRDCAAVIDGVLSDLRGAVRFETEADSLLYCDRVAGAVGKGVLAILGTQKTACHAEILACGRAFQWTNFLRDLREDILLRERVYFPMSDFREVGLDPTELFTLLTRGKAARPLVRFRLADPHDPLTRFLNRQIERIEIFYADSDHLTDSISAEGRKVFRFMRERYRAIFHKIVRHQEQIFIGPVHLTFWEKVRLLLTR